ncbi:MAG: hypothetical protein RLZZ241_1767 [Bacteroidota bacterium]|jgi:hypothetical protein
MISTSPAIGLALFGISESDCRTEPASDGYINDTFKVWMGEKPRYILQRISATVFGDGVGLMKNVALVLPHLKAQDYSELKLIATPNASKWAHDSEGNAWRMYEFIEGSHTISTSASVKVAQEAGRIIGKFHLLLAPINPSELHLTLPRFHDLNWRSEQLETAINTGISQRIAEAHPWIVIALELIATCLDIPWEKLPVRVCHNDTKLSNILFNSAAEEALCLIDLDTIMPGYFLYDVGDAVRTITNPLTEDHRNWEEISLNLALFRPFMSGIKQSGLHLNPHEIETLHIGPILLPLLHGIRALSDYLLGDVYYKISYPDQNMVRARSLLRVAQLTAIRMDELQKICQEELA